MDGITVNIRGTFKGDFDKVASEMPNIEKRALYRAAYFLRDKVKQSLISKIPKATVRNPKYNDTLADAIWFTKVDGASTTLHAMGSRQKGSGTFRTRFFEGGTKERFHKTYNGQKLKVKRSIGKIEPTHFFSSAVNANSNAAIEIMRETVLKYVNETLDK